jgi:hypothetical protein
LRIWAGTLLLRTYGIHSPIVNFDHSFLLVNLTIEI